MDVVNLCSQVVTLYPMDYQYRFAAEFVQTFERGLADARGRKWATARFLLREAYGSARGLALEWLAKWATDGSVRSRQLPDYRIMRLPWVPRREMLGTTSCSSDISR